MDFLEIVKDFLVTAIGSFIGFYGAYVIFKRQEREKIRQNHSVRLKEEVLQPWLENLEADSVDLIKTAIRPDVFVVENRFGYVNLHLLNDLLKNHIPKLNSLKISVEKIREEIKKKANMLDENYKKKFPRINEINVVSIASFLAGDGKYNQLHLTGSYRIMHLQESVAFTTDAEEELKRLKLELENDYNSKLGKEWRALKKKLEEKISALKSEINFALATERLPGKCNFID